MPPPLLSAAALLFAFPNRVSVAAWVLYSPYDAAMRGEGYFLHGVGAPWSGPSAFDLAVPVFRWSLPPFANASDGLGRGITWAMHPDFCKQMMPAFRGEYLLFGAVRFLTCDSLRSAVDDALATWSSNHRAIVFKDVTDACSAPGGFDAATDRCRLAEVTISTQSMDGPMHDAAAYVRVSTQPGTVDRAPFTTAGDRVVHGIGARRADLRVATSACWYLDATFCAAFHTISRLGDWRIGALRITTFAVFAVGVLGILYFAGRIVAASFGHESVLEGATLLLPRCLQDETRVAKARGALRRSTNMRCRTLLEYLSRVPILALLFCMFWVLFTPIFYVTVFLPCVECEGFSGMIAHEAGHLLGFQHPDVFGEMNLQADPSARMDESTCHDPMAHVRLSPLRSGTPQEDTVMNSMTAHRPVTCLTRDDLEGLNFLYPTCDPAEVVASPVCTKPLQLTGYLRLSVAVIVPYSIVSLLVIASQNTVRMLQRRHVAKLRENVHRRNQQGTWLRAGVRASWIGAHRTAETNAAARASCAAQERGRRLSDLLEATEAAQASSAALASVASRDAGTPLASGSTDASEGASDLRETLALVASSLQDVSQLTSAMDTNAPLRSWRHVTRRRFTRKHAVGQGGEHLVRALFAPTRRRERASGASASHSVPPRRVDPLRAAPPRKRFEAGTFAAARPGARPPIRRGSGETDGGGPRSPGASSPRTGSVVPRPSVV